MTNFKNREITAIDGGIITVGDNYGWSETASVNAVDDSIVFVEAVYDYSDNAVMIGLTRDEAVDLIDNLLAVLEEYGVAPKA